MSARAGASDKRPQRRRAARLWALEADRWRSFEDAQREADTMFAQYQLSQLLASGGDLSALATAVLDELLRACDASAGALWLSAPGEPELELVASVREHVSGTGRQGGHRRLRPVLPRVFADAGAATAWCRRHGWQGVALEERRDLGERGFEQALVGFVALGAPAGSALTPEHARFLALVRHELAMAFRAAQLREALASERSLLSAILDGASEAIIAVDATRQVVRLNQAALSLLHDAEAQPQGATCREYLGCGPDEHAQDGRLRCGQTCPFEDVLRGAAPITNREHSIIGRDDVEVPVVGSYARMSGPDAGAVAVLRDLRAARAIDELKSSFVAAVSHELRTPLALIRGYVESVLHLELEPEAQRRFIVRIGQAADRLSELVGEILDTAHLESDRLALRRERVELAEVVGSLTADLAELPGTPPVAVDVPADLPRVDADPARLTQVLANLVANAAKYGGGKDARITVRARHSGRTVVVTVEDLGAGIAADERAHVFERFYRGGRVRQTSTPGSGLGLYVCQRLVEAHGGHIWLDDPPVGTSVSFSLPVAAIGGRRRTAAGAR
jgi:signal transduction histidine kinase